jgi:hypothetical protein
MMMDFSKEVKMLGKRGNRIESHGKNGEGIKGD